MTLGQKQRKLCKILTAIEMAAYAMGYDLVREDAYRNPKAHGAFGLKRSYAAAHSVHKVKLAQDYSLFKDGAYLGSGNEAVSMLNTLHDIGDILGLAPRIKNDLNHFSIGHNGYR